jgi:predicted transcriptional regulator
MKIARGPKSDPRTVLSFTLQFEAKLVPMKVKRRSSSETHHGRPDSHKIDNLKVARYLLEPQHQTTLEPFMVNEVTVTQVSEVLKLDFRKTYALVKRLERYGLIRTVRLEQRDGRPIRHYRATASSFFVPISLVPVHQVLQIVNGQFEQVFAEQFTRATWGELSQGCGVQVWVREQGIGCQVVQAPNQFFDPLLLEFSATYGMWYQWSLDFEEAKALQHELFALSEKYSRREGSQMYLVHLAMTPVQS